MTQRPCRHSVRRRLLQSGRAFYLLGQLLLTIASADLLADELATDGGPLRIGGTIWMGSSGTVPLRTIAERAAPILWFSPDEPLLYDGKNGPFPSRLPCDVPASGAVVYYRLARVIVRDGAKPPEPSFDPILLDSLLSVDLVFYFYYRKDFGGGCHVNDLESALFRILVVRDAGQFTLRITRVMGAAHGHLLFANELDLHKGLAGRDTSLPVTLLVEEGKHATCPDRNADGHYTPGYDVNSLVTDAWGIRDVFGSGLVGRASYEASMTKRRREDGRIAPLVPLSEALWAASERSGLRPPSHRYELRSIPAVCLGYRDPPKEPGECCRLLSLAKKMRQERFGELPQIGTGSVYRRFLSTPKQMLKSLSLQAQDGLRYLGFSMVLPVSSDLPLFGGYLGLKTAVTLVERRPDIEGWRSLPRQDRERLFRESTDDRGFFWSNPGRADFSVTYTPSRSRRVEWFAGTGASFSTGQGRLLGGGRPFVEGGVQFRQQLEALRIPFFVVGVGAQWRDARGWTSVVELRLGSYVAHPVSGQR